MNSIMHIWQGTLILLQIVTVMDCHLVPALTDCYAGNVVLTMFVGLKRHSYKKGGINTVPFQGHFRSL